MAKRLSRRELYDRVWTEPMRTLASGFGISDVALKKTCARAHIPTPDRGYWAKREAGKPTRQVPLPPRPLGMDDEVDIGGGNRWYWHWTREELLAPIPPAPEFEDTTETVRERIRQAIGKVAVSRDVRIRHPAIDRLLAEDEKRRQKQQASPYPSPWDDPLFDAPLERRRLRVLNSLFLAAAKLGAKPTIRGREARDIHLSFHHQHVGLTLDPPKPRTGRGRGPDHTAAADRLCLAILVRLGSQEVEPLGPTTSRANWKPA